MCADHQPPNPMPPATQCRHCNPFSLSDTYASMLVANGQLSLSRLIDTLETRLIPCVTAVCPGCDQTSIVSSGSVESVLRTVVMWQRLGEWIDQDKYEEGGNYDDMDMPRQKAGKMSPIT